jgi:hypothetical protein
MFRKTSDGWMRRKLIGGQSVEEVQDFIKEGLVLDATDQQDPPSTEEESDVPSDKTS